MQLDRGVLMALAEILDLGCEINESQTTDVHKTGVVTSGQEAQHAPMIGAHAVGIPDGGDKELEKLFGRGVTG